MSTINPTFRKSSSCQSGNTFEFDHTINCEAARYGPPMEPAHRRMVIKERFGKTTPVMVSGADEKNRLIHAKT